MLGLHLTRQKPATLRHPRNTLPKYLLLQTPPAAPHTSTLCAESMLQPRANDIQPRTQSTLLCCSTLCVPCKVPRAARVGASPRAQRLNAFRAYVPSVGLHGFHPAKHAGAAQSLARRAIARHAREGPASPEKEAQGSAIQAAAPAGQRAHGRLAKGCATQPAQWEVRGRPW